MDVFLGSDEIYGIDNEPLSGDVVITIDRYTGYNILFLTSARLEISAIKTSVRACLLTKAAYDGNDIPDDCISQVSNDLHSIRDDFEQGLIRAGNDVDQVKHVFLTAARQMSQLDQWIGNIVDELDELDESNELDDMDDYQDDSVDIDAGVNAPCARKGLFMGCYPVASKRRPADFWTWKRGRKLCHSLKLQKL